MTPKKVAVAKTVASALGVLLLISLLIPIKSCPSLPSARTESINQLKQLSLGCRAYAADWDGSFPTALEDLYPDYIDEMELFHALDESGKKIPIIYWGGNAKVKEGEKIALLEWPVHFGDRKIVAYSTGHITEERIEP